ELCGNPQLVARASHTSFEHGIGANLLPDLPDVLSLAFELKRARPRDYPKPWDPREGIRDLFRDAVAEVVLARTTAHVHERQHHNRLHGPNVRAARPAPVRPASHQARYHCAHPDPTTRKPTL